MTEAQLRAFHSADEVLFTRLVTEHSGRVLTYLEGYAGGETTAEDLVQETWVRAYRRRETYRGDGSFLGWLLAVSRSVGLDHLRRRTSELRRRDGARNDSDCVSARDPIQALDRAHRVRAALAALPARQRDTVVLRILQDKSIRDTAAALGVAEGTVKATLGQALRRLREVIQSDNETA